MMIADRSQETGPHQRRKGGAPGASRTRDLLLRRSPRAGPGLPVRSSGPIRDPRE
jgi:hypothetical protein